MPIDCNNCDYLSPHNNTKYGQPLGDVHKSQVQYICNLVMFLAWMDAQYQHYNETIDKIFMEEIPLLLPKFETPKWFEEIPKFFI